MVNICNSEVRFRVQRHLSVKTTSILLLTGEKCRLQATLLHGLKANHNRRAFSGWHRFRLRRLQVAEIVLPPSWTEQKLLVIENRLYSQAKRQFWSVLVSIHLKTVVRVFIFACHRIQPMKERLDQRSMASHKKQLKPLVLNVNTTTRLIRELWIICWGCKSPTQAQTLFSSAEHEPR